MHARSSHRAYLRARLPSVEQNRGELVEESGEGLLEERVVALAVNINRAHINAVGPLRVHVGPHRVDDELDALREPQHILSRQPHLLNKTGMAG